MIDERLLLEPLGVIRTPFTSKYTAPRQPGTARRKTTGIITLRPGSNFEQAVEDLAGFDYIWVLFWFHRNSTWKPKVLPPAGDRKKRGLFATRSPHRPNPIGLSLCRLLDVKGLTIRVENPDMLDGTPVLDIKPYLPHAESHPEARSGWIGEMHEESSPAFRVVIAGSVRAKLTTLPRAERADIESYLVGTLSRDPFPHSYRRIKPANDGSFVVAVRTWRFRFRISGRTVRVLSASLSAGTPPPG